MGLRLFPRLYEGWVIVVACAILYLLVGASFTYGFGAIFNEVLDEFGWSVAATAFAFSLRSEVGGVAAPVVGIFIDRIGAQRVIVAGILITVTGVLLLSVVQSLWQFYAAMLIGAAGVSASGSQVGLAATATWFEKRRARAMSIMTLGGGIGGLLAVAMAVLVEEFGWRVALRILAVVMLVAGLGITTLIRSRPDAHPQPMDGIAAPRVDGEPPPPAARWGIPAGPAIRSRSFFLLTLAMIALLFATTSVVVHQLPYLETEIGVSKSAAGTSVLVFTVASIAGRLGLGFLADRYPKRVVMAAATGLVAAGLPVLALADSFAVAILGVIIIAPGYGAMMPVRPALFADYFGTRHFATINGAATFIAQTGGAAGPWAVGWIVDRSGGYAEGWLVTAGIALAGIPLFLLAQPPAALAQRYQPAAAVA